MHISDTPYSILLATFNGSRFIEDFLKSCPWPAQADLMVRDDGSTDNTIERIQNFTAKHSIPCTLHAGERLGAKNNFAALLEKLEKPYFFLADQDDIWEQEKIPTMLKSMHDLEKKYGKETPILIYSDASLMHASGSIYHNSFFKNSMLPEYWNANFRNVLVMPHVLGCTMCGNKALAQASIPIAEEAIMHDAWLLQVASVLGKVHEIAEPYIRYRQHETNVFGAKTLTWANAIKKLCNGRKPKYEAIVRSQKQGAALLKHYAHLMSNEHVELCKAWAEAENKSWIFRRIVYAKYGFKKAGWVHNAVLWICG